MNNSSLKLCTGKNIRVVILDIGVVEGVHCINYNGNIEVMEDSKAFIDNTHASNCIKAAKINAPEAEYVLINVGDKELGVVTEEAVLAGMQIAMEIAPKIIIMSFSFEHISNELKKRIADISDNGTIICASVDPVVRNSFPQSLSSCLSVDESRSPENSDEVWYCDGIFYVPPTLYSAIEMRGSSIANAYLGGEIARLAQFSPFITTASLKTFYKQKTLNKPVTPIHNAVYLLLGQHSLEDPSKELLPHYAFLYDDSLHVFKSISSNEEVSSSAISGVDIILADDYLVRQPLVSDHFKKEKIPFTIYDNFTEDLSYLNEDISSLKSITVPSICICSYGRNMEKLRIQMHINAQMKMNGYSCGNISFNPLGRILGYNFLKFPKTISAPQYIYHFNDQLYRTSQNADVLVVSIAGNFDRFINYEHRLGDISWIAFTAHSPDIVILNLPGFVQPDELLRVKNYVTKAIGAKLIFYISKHSRDDDYHGPSDYNLVLDKGEVSAYRKNVETITREKAFCEKDIESGAMWRHLYKLLQ